MTPKTKAAKKISKLFGPHPKLKTTSDIKDIIKKMQDNTRVRENVANCISGKRIVSEYTNKFSTSQQ